MNWIVFFQTLWGVSLFFSLFWLVWDWIGYTLWEYPEYHRLQLVRILVTCLYLVLSFCAFVGLAAQLK